MKEEAKRILVAEDDIAMGGVIRFNLEKAGFEVTVARCGRTAWNLLSEHSYDLLISDFQMPGMTGGELCQRMQQDAKLSQIPVILLTAKGYELDKSMLRHQLARSTVFFKPFSPRELIQTVQECLAAGVADAWIGP
jgi:DNA-binding response OmpR family regulator